MAFNPTHIHEVAKVAERIYNDKYRTEYEISYPGKFVVIDVKSERAFVGDYSEDALQKALRECPGGIFHLFRIGADGAFRVGYSRNYGTLDWLSR
jgi:hypothetical protein